MSTYGMHAAARNGTKSEKVTGAGRCLNCQKRLIDGPKPPSPHHRKHWSRPIDGFQKINTDGSFNIENGSGTWGHVISDEHATITHAGAGSCQHLLNALHAELLACVQGIAAATSQGMSRVLLDTDSQLVKSALETNSFALAETGGIVYELECMIGSSFTDFKISNAPRDYNRVAHAVAALDCNCSNGTTLHWEDTLDGLEELVASDSAESELME
ncbi:hypothetical protein C2845_PM09G10400 [Panicum miliaceum]|uniref:RNase H type-1 domain-containing protein n=1 Tax=Panicum miliaceum TaxID=4540 RepID=A0A3L6S1L1_PANMI|nr:hypothetical protein C2845_PM09G10400 [Panicum miliaceum]